MAVSLAKAAALSADQIREIAETLDGGAALPGWQTRLAKSLDKYSDRSVTPAQVSIWTSGDDPRGAPWWATKACYHALQAAIDELQLRTIACRKLAANLQAGPLGKLRGEEISSITSQVP